MLSPKGAARLVGAVRDLTPHRGGSIPPSSTEGIIPRPFAHDNNIPPETGAGYGAQKLLGLLTTESGTGWRKRALALAQQMRATSSSGMPASCLRSSSWVLGQVESAWG